MGSKVVSSVSPIYIKLLLAAVAAYVAATSYWLGNLVTRVGEIEHKIEHKTSHR